MKRMICAFAVLLLMLAAGAVLAEEETVPPALPNPGMATPTDLCAHENTNRFYYFDSPAYRAKDEESHIVAGRAMVEEICGDCGAVLLSIMEDNAEEISPHVFRGSQCVLCGWEKPAAAVSSELKEVVTVLSSGEDSPNQYFCTLTGKDLETAGDILVLRPAGCDAALALKAGKIREEIRRTGGTFTAEIGKPESRTVSTFIRMYNADGRETQPDPQDIVLRIYTENDGIPLKVTYTDGRGNTRLQEASWTESGDDGSFWAVPWLGNGLYRY